MQDAQAEHCEWKWAFDCYLEDFCGLHAQANNADSCRRSSGPVSCTGHPAELLSIALYALECEHLVTHLQHIVTNL